MVHWQGLPIEEATWENVEDVLNAYPAFNLEDKVVVNCRGVGGGGVIDMEFRKGRARRYAVRGSTTSGV